MSALRRLTMAEVAGLVDLGVRIEHVDPGEHEPMIGLTQVDVLMLLGSAHGCGVINMARTAKPFRFQYCRVCNAQAMRLFQEH